MHKKKWLHWLKIVSVSAIVFLLFLIMVGTVAQASGLVDTTVSEENLYSKYSLDNYQLDFFVDKSWDWLPWNWDDGIGKSVNYGLYAITNFIWTVSLYLSNATGYVIQEAYKLDFISDTADSIGKNIQTLAGITSSGFSSEGFYVGFLLIFILIVGMYVGYVGLIKRESSKAIHAVLNFVTVFLLSASFIAYAPDYITKLNDFSSDVSSSALSLGTKIITPNSDTEGADSVDLIRDSLFSVQVEQPWLLLQFGDSDKSTIGKERVNAVLSIDPNENNGKDRESAVKTEINDFKNQNMTLTKTTSRLGTVVFLFLFNLGITIFIFLLTGIMIFSQILFIIFAMFLPISFLLSMLPTYQGMAKKALEKLFNTMMMRAGITLVVTTAFSISSMFYNLSTSYPFFMVAFLQIVTFAGIYFRLGDLMSLFRLQSNDSQQLGRHVLRHPRQMMRHGTRQIQRKLGRALTLGGVAATLSRKHKKAPMPYKPNTAVDLPKPKFSERMGQKAGALSETPNRFKEKAKNMKEQVQDLPVNAQYAVVKGLNKPKESVSTFKRGLSEQKQTEQAARKATADKKRQTIAEKRQALERTRQNRKQGVQGNSPTTKSSKNIKKTSEPSSEIFRDANRQRDVSNVPAAAAQKLEKELTSPQKESRSKRQNISTNPVTKKAYMNAQEINQKMMKQPAQSPIKQLKKGGGKGENKTPRSRK